MLFVYWQFHWTWNIYFCNFFLYFKIISSKITRYTTLNHLVNYFTSKTLQNHQIFFLIKLFSSFLRVERTKILSVLFWNILCIQVIKNCTAVPRKPCSIHVMINPLKICHVEVYIDFTLNWKKETVEIYLWKKKSL